MSTDKYANLRAAAQAVIERWDTPNWKDAPATAEYIGRLRQALAASREARPSPMPYTSAIGEAGEKYMDQFKEHAHPLPALFRWEDLWNALVLAAAPEAPALADPRCGQGCACLVQCGDVYAHAAELAAQSDVATEADDYKRWYEEAMVASNEAGFVGLTAAETIRELAAQVDNAGRA